MRASLLPGPLAVHEDGDLGAVGEDARDGEVVGAHHEVHVGRALVDAVLEQRLLAELGAPGDALREAHAERQVAARVLVVEGVVEERVALADRRVLGDERDLAEDGAAFLFLEGSDPSALKGIDPAKPAAASKARNTECRSFRDGMDFGRNAWCIAGVPVEAWAREVFPDASPSEAVYRLWRLILEVSRADGEDPESAWETHNASFEKTKRYLNSHRFDALRYESSNGTDLTVGLTDGHIWDGGAGRTQSGVTFFPNIPTEEVFTSPDRMRAEGIVYSSMPLVRSGQIVRDFWLRFEGGCVVDYGAEQGREVLRHILETDEGARRLGEVALVSKNTPIRQSDTLFYDTLYDENASCHLALGMGFPECIAGGVSLSKDALLARGVNQSSTHVDFMIGSEDMNIYGVAADGTETPVFVNGQWAWE